MPKDAFQRHSFFALCELSARFYVRTTVSPYKLSCKGMVRMKRLKQPVTENRCATMENQLALFHQKHVDHHGKCLAAESLQNRVRCLQA